MPRVLSSALLPPGGPQEELYSRKTAVHEVRTQQTSSRDALLDEIDFLRHENSKLLERQTLLEDMVAKAVYGGPAAAAPAALAGAPTAVQDNALAAAPAPAVVPAKDPVDATTNSPTMASVPVAEVVEGNVELVNGLHAYMARRASSSNTVVPPAEGTPPVMAAPSPAEVLEVEPKELKYMQLDVQSELSVATEELKSLRKEAATTVEELERVQTELDEAREEVEGLTAELEVATEESRRLAREKGMMRAMNENALNDHQAQRDAMKAEAEAEHAKCEQLQAEVTALKAELEAAKDAQGPPGLGDGVITTRPPPPHAKLWADEAVALERAAEAHRRHALLQPLHIYTVFLLGFAKGRSTSS